MVTWWCDQGHRASTEAECVSICLHNQPLGEGISHFLNIPTNFDIWEHLSEVGNDCNVRDSIALNSRAHRIRM